MTYNFKNSTVQNFEEIFSQIIDLKISSDEIKKILLQLNEDNLPENAFIGAVNTLKKRMVKISAPQDAIDVCGTGGDKLNSLNISTAVSFVVAALGIPVAKHGNKAVSSASGSADIFSELNVKISSNFQEIENNLKENKLAFLFAPFFHDALKNIASIRKELGIPTIFNFLGPILNPANIQKQLIGTSRKDVMIKMLNANFDKNNKEQKTYIVHGMDGMDEISLCANSYLIKLENGKIYDEEIINPEKYGLKKVKIEDLRGKDSKYNAQRLLNLLEGEESAYRQITLLNSAFALKLAGKIDKIEDGIDLAKSSIDNGLAKNLLNKIKIKN